MQTFSKTAATIAEKLNLYADVLVFRTVTGCEDRLFEEITCRIGGHVLCVLPCSPNARYREGLSGGNRFFVGKSIPQKENADAFKAVQECEHCVLFASVSMLADENFLSFLQAHSFSALLILQAENVSPVLHSFDKRLHEVQELRAQLPYKLPVCAFCATDSSPVLRDMINNLQLKTPSRFYPGVSITKEALHSQQANIPFTAFESHVRTNKITRALVFCTTRQTAEDAYRYFRFFGYKCALIHGGIDRDKRRTAVDRFLDGETDFLFTTQFTQTPFCEQAFDTVFLGLPSDVWMMQNLVYPGNRIYCFYTQDDKNETIYRTEEDNELRSKYTNLPAFNLKTERLLQAENVLRLIQQNISPLQMLQKEYEQIYFNDK